MIKIETKKQFMDYLSSVITKISECISSDEVDVALVESDRVLGNLVDSETLDEDTFDWALSLIHDLALQTKSGLSNSEKLKGITDTLASITDSPRPFMVLGETKKSIYELILLGRSLVGVGATQDEVDAFEDIILLDLAKKEMELSLTFTLPAAPKPHDIKSKV